MTKQDLGKLQTRKMKGLKKRQAPDSGETPSSPKKIKESE